MACRSAPTLNSLTVPEGTAFAVTNELGRSAVVYVGDASVLPVADGDGALLTLTPGQHDVRMVPDCLEVAAAAPLAVTVTPNEPTPAGTTATSPASRPSSAAPPAGTTNPASPPDPPAGAGQPRPTTAAPRTSPVDSAEPEIVAGATAEPTARPRSGSGAAAPGVVSAEPLSLDDESHSKGLRLLAAVASICVLGVTAAIIRAIVRLSP
jgi:hypothetical protein